MLAALLAACASSPPADEGEPPVRAEHDPFESLNRSLYAINDAVDRVTLRS